MKDIKIEKNKFLVLNIKHVMETSEKTINDFIVALETFYERYEKETGKKLNQTYIVCNQDEPYSEKVWETILDGEKEKLTNKK